MGSYRLTNKALTDISAIWEYTVENWSVTQADYYYFLLLGACQDVADGKITGKNYTEINPAIFGYRIGQHIIFYSYIADNIILIVRFLHVQMDLKNRIQET